jgi:hypothetical protein
MVDLATFGKETPLKFRLDSDWNSGIFTSNAFSEFPVSIADRIINFVDKGVVMDVVDSKYNSLEDRYAAILNKTFEPNNIYNKETAAGLTALRSIAALPSSGRLYEFYKAQERSAIQAAKATAKSIQMKGDIELRNLKYLNEQKLGKELNKLGSKRGNLSGSNLDVIMFEQKQQLMDQTTLQNKYDMQAANVIRNGYLNSVNLALQAKTQAGTDKLKLLGAVLNGVDKYFSLDAKEQVNQINRDVQQRVYVDQEIARYKSYKGKAQGMMVDPAQPKYSLDIYSPNSKIDAAVTFDSETPFTNSLLNAQGFQENTHVSDFIQF